ITPTCRIRITPIVCSQRFRRTMVSLLPCPPEDPIGQRRSWPCSLSGKTTDISREHRLRRGELGFWMERLQISALGTDPYAIGLSYKGCINESSPRILLSGPLDIPKPDGILFRFRLRIVR